VKITTKITVQQNQLITEKNLIYKKVVNYPVSSDAV